MKGSIIGTLLYGDLEEIKSGKAFCFYILRMAICVSGIVYFISANQLLNNVSISFYFNAIALGTFLYSFLFLLSTFLYNKKVVLFNVLPIKKEEIFIYIWLDLLIEIFITKFVPLLAGISFYLIYHGKATGYECAVDMGKGFFVFLSFSALALVVVIYIGVSKKLRAGISLGIAVLLLVTMNYYIKSFAIYVIMTVALISVSYLVYRIHYENVITKRRVKGKLSSGLLPREFHMFFGDKILVTNFVVSTVISIFFTINLIINHIHLGFMVAVMTLLPLYSVTTFALYSYEGERIKLIESLPLRKVTVFFNKYVLSLAITLSSVSIISVILILGQVVKINFILLYVLSALFICAEKILLDMGNPYIKFSHTEELLRNSRKYKMYGVTILGYIPLLLVDTGIPLYLLCLISVILNGAIICKLVKDLKSA